MNLFLFHGNDSYSSSKKIQTWRNEFTKKFGDSDIEILEARGLDIAQVRTNIEALPFLADKRLIILKNFISEGKKEDQEKLAGDLSKVPKSCILIFHENKAADKRLKIYKQIAKFGKVEEFKPLEPDQISRWITAECKKHNFKISFQAANHFSQTCSHEMWAITNEFEKLRNYCNGEEITKEMIDKIVTPSLNASIFRLTDSIATKDYKDAIHTFKILQECGEDLTRIFFMIVRHFRIMIQIRDMQDKGEPEFSMQKKLKQHPFVIKKTNQQARNFDKEKLVQIYSDLLTLDTRFKTGQIKMTGGDKRNYELEIEKLIVECCS